VAGQMYCSPQVFTTTITTNTELKPTTEY